MEVSDHLHAPAVLPQEKKRSTHWIGNGVDPRAGLDGFGEENISFLYRDSNPLTFQSEQSENGLVLQLV
jgi:hypothetical protein